MDKDKGFDTIVRPRLEDIPNNVEDKVEVPTEGIMALSQRGYRAA
jgi:hypothetical protein